MRIPVLVIGSLFLILGVGGYLNFSKQWRLNPEPSPIETLNDLFVVELTPTFEAAQGDFSSIEPVSGELRLNGKLLWESRAILPAGLPITISPEPIFVAGENELWVAFYRQGMGVGDDFGFQDDEATRSRDFEAGTSSYANDTTSVCGVRVRIIQNQRVVLDETLWSVLGGVPGGVLKFKLHKNSTGSDRISRAEDAERTEGVSL